MLTIRAPEGMVDDHGLSRRGVVPDELDDAVSRDPSSLVARPGRFAHGPQADPGPSAEQLGEDAAALASYPIATIRHA